MPPTPSAMYVLHVVGARPNFMKVAPVMRALKARSSVQQILVHTGQHYDPNMSQVFLRQLGIPEPDVNLAVGAGSHASQTAEIMTRFEPIVLDKKPNRVLIDQLADLLFTPSDDDDVNLRSEGVAREKIHQVGNVMIDALLRLLPQMTL